MERYCAIFTRIFKVSILTQPVFKDKNYGYRIGLGLDLENTTTLSFSYTNFQNAQSAIVLKETIDYDFEFRRHQVMINFAILLSLISESLHQTITVPMVFI